MFDWHPTTTTAVHADEAQNARGLGTPDNAAAQTGTPPCGSKPNVYVNGNFQTSKGATAHFPFSSKEGFLYEAACPGAQVSLEKWECTPLSPDPRSR